MQIENLIVRDDIPVHEEKDDEYYDGLLEYLKENGELRKELEEYNKRGQTLHNLMNAKDTYMYKEICKNFIPKDKIKARIEELKKTIEEIEANENKPEMAHYNPENKKRLAWGIMELYEILEPEEE